jgi:hypothetical protein
MVDERKMKRTVLARALSVFAVAASVATVSGSACAAGGAVLSSADIPQAARGSLESAIAEARKSDPKSFEDVAALRRRLPEFDAKKRGEVAMIAIPLEDMGPRALWPIVEELAFQSEPAGDLTPGAWRDWRVALIEALGLIHDPRTEPVVLSLLAKRDNDVPLLRASVEAAGRLGTRAAVNKIVALRPGDLALRRAVWEGMGECHAMACVQTLGTSLAASVSDGESTAIVARALGRSASSWAWQTPGLAATGEGPAVRAAAAKALVGAFSTVAASASRDSILRALTVVEDPSTVKLLRDLRQKADPELARDLDKAIERFAASPAR